MKTIMALLFRVINLPTFHFLSKQRNSLRRLTLLSLCQGIRIFVDLIIHLKGEGVRVEIAAVRQTAAKILIDESDYFHEITKEDWFVYKSPKKTKVERR